MFLRLEGADLVLVAGSLGQKLHALAFRDGDFMRFVSLHPDHDSAYR